MVNDLIILSMYDLYMGNNCKFAAHFIGLFKALKCAGKLDYCIELPFIYSAFYNVFHVSKSYIPGGSDGTSTNVQPVLVDGKEQYEVEKIYGRMWSCN